VATGSIPIRSWTAKTSFFVLGKIADSGGGTAEILEQITVFSSNVNQTRNDTKTSISVISYFAMLSPVMMAYTTKEMAGILAKLNSSVSHMAYGAFGVQTMLVSGDLMMAVNLLNVMSAISIGLVMAKLTHFTVKHTLLLGISALISLASLVSAPLFPSLVRI
jgi:flagellar protein FlaJ